MIFFSYLFFFFSLPCRLFFSSRPRRRPPLPLPLISDSFQFLISQPQTPTPTRDRKESHATSREGEEAADESERPPPSPTPTPLQTLTLLQISRPSALPPRPAPPRCDPAPRVCAGAVWWWVPVRGRISDPRSWSWRRAHMKDPAHRTKVVLRRLPPAIAQQVVVDQVDARFAGRYDWSCFRPGNARSAFSLPRSPSPLGVR